MWCVCARVIFTYTHTHNTHTHTHTQTHTHTHTYIRTYVYLNPIYILYVHIYIYISADTVLTTGRCVNRLVQAQGLKQAAASSPPTAGGNGSAVGDSGAPLACPANCSEHGVCQQNGTCLCDPGWGGGGCETWVYAPLADISVKISGQAEASFEIVDVVYHPAANYDMVRISERDRDRERHRHRHRRRDRKTERERESCLQPCHQL